MTPEEFAAKLRELGEKAPQALESTMVEGAMLLGGRLVQKEIAAAKPQPVDMGQYKAGWQMTPVEGGAVVGNSTKQSTFIERGRGPGKVPFQPILEWVQRKGLARRSLKQKRALAREQRRREKAARPPKTPRPKGPGAPEGGEAPKAKEREPVGPFEKYLRKAQAKQRKAAEELAEAKTIALAVQRKIAQQGIEPKWILRRAMHALGSPLHKMLKRALKEAMR